MPGEESIGGAGGGGVARGFDPRISPSHLSVHRMHGGEGGGARGETEHAAICTARTHSDGMWSDRKTEQRRTRPIGKQVGE